MLNFIKKDFRRSMWIIRIVLAIAISFGLMFETNSLMIFMSLYLSQTITRSIIFNILFGIIAVLFYEIFIKFIVNYFLRASNVYNLPRQEIILFALLFHIPYFVVLGLFNLLFFIYPHIYLWGSLIFPIIVAIPCLILFFNTINKLYLNVQTAPNFFKMILIYFAVVYGINILLAVFLI